MELSGARASATSSAAFDGSTAGLQDVSAETVSAGADINIDSEGEGEDEGEGELEGSADGRVMSVSKADEIEARRLACAFDLIEVRERCFCLVLRRCSLPM